MNEIISPPPPPSSAKPEVPPNVFQRLATRAGQVAATMFGPKDQYELVEEKLQDPSRRRFLRAAGIGTSAVATGAVTVTPENLDTALRATADYIDQNALPATAELLYHEKPLNATIDFIRNTAEKNYKQQYEKDSQMLEVNRDRKSMLDMIKESVAKVAIQHPEIVCTFQQNADDLQATADFDFTKIAEKLKKYNLNLSSIVSNAFEETPEYWDARTAFLEEIQADLTNNQSLSPRARLLLKACFGNYDGIKDIVNLNIDGDTSLSGKGLVVKTDDKNDVSGLDKVMEGYMQRFEKGEQICVSDILADRIQANDGKMSYALYDTGFILELLTRTIPREYYLNIDNIGGMHLIIAVENFAKGVKDEFSPYNSDWGTNNTPPPESAPRKHDPNKSVINRIGIPYHVFNIASLLPNFDNKFIKAMTVGQMVGWYDQQGELKAMADMDVLKELDSIRTYLSTMPTGSF